MCTYQSKKKVNEQFGRKMNDDVNGNTKLFWKELSNVKGGKDRNIRLAEDEVQRMWKEYFEDLYNIDTQEQVGVHMYGFDGIQRGNYIRGEPIGRDEVEV